MKVKITPRLYRLTAISAHDTHTEIYTDPNVAELAESDIWEIGGIVSTTIDYANVSVAGEVVWHKSAEV